MRQEHRPHRMFPLIFAVFATLGCRDEAAPLRQPPPPKRLPQGAQTSPERGKSILDVEQARALFGSLPMRAERSDGPSSAPLIALGRQLYYEKRLSKNHDISCNSCHDLLRYGVDVRKPGSKTSEGHKGAVGDRNAPTVYNAALHVAQFWDGRAEDVEEQAKGPVLNPVEMALPSEAFAVRVLRSIPAYQALFKEAFPKAEQPVTFDNMARAIGAFERGLMTPAPFDKWLAGDATALTRTQERGLHVFIESGCTACHFGPTVGGRMYQKLGLLKPYPTQDRGRVKITGNEADAFLFKVPSLRNVAETAPYLHDGSIGTLEEMVALMTEYQTPAGSLSPQDTADLVAFLHSLTGDLPTEYIAEPPSPPPGRQTPEPNPS